MNQSKMVLVDGTEINLEDGASLGDMRVASADMAAMTVVWSKLTPDNLKSVQIVTDDAVSGEYVNLVLDRETSKMQPDGSIRTSFCIRQKTELELLRDEIAEIRAGQSVQDGAIEDLGAITSVIAGQVEGGVQ